MRKSLSEWGSFYWVVPIVVLSFLLTLLVEYKAWKRKVLWTMLAVWVVALVYLMFIYRLPPKRGTMNLEFFHMFRSAVGYQGNVATNQSLRQIFFNILLFVPLGTILCALIGKRWTSICIGIGVSILTEWLQYLTNLGMADVDDVISNTLGLIAGVLLYRAGRCVHKIKQDTSND